MSNIQHKTKHLITLIQKMSPLIVSFSGGLDSSYLLAKAVEAIGKKNVIAVTAQAPFFSPFETQYIDAIINKTDVRHIVFEHQAMLNETFVRNPPDRCYHCKKMIFSKIRDIADTLNVKYIAHGANTDDLHEYRPGTQAVEEYDIKAPLTAAHLSKAEISCSAKKMGLVNWNQPAMACLATRIPHNSMITMDKFTMIHQAERFLFDMGFPGARVRLHDRTAKIEVRKKQLPDFLKGKCQDTLFELLKNIGFLDMIVDLEGYCEKI